MAANIFGLTTLTFGTPTATGYIVNSMTNSATANVNAEVFDETGHRVSARYDDVTQEVTFEALVNGAALPSPGGTFVADSITYEIVSVESRRVNNDYMRHTIRGKKSEYM